MGDVVDMNYDEWVLDFHGLYTGKVNSSQKPDGFGHMISNEPLSSINNYKGLWENGVMRDGKIEFNDGSAFVGTFDDYGYLNYGRFTYSNGMIYIGYFMLNKRHNHGQMYYANSIYDGYWDNDMRHGNGKLTFVDGREYNGLWIKNHAVNGTFTDNGVSYTGSWANAAPNCGTITWPTGFALEVNNACCIVPTYEQYMTLCTLQRNSTQECNDAVDPIFAQKIVSTEQDLSHPLLYHIERASLTPDIDIRLRLQHPIFANDLKNVQVCPECRYNYNKTDSFMKWVKLQMKPFAAVKIQRFFRTTSIRSNKRGRESSKGGNKIKNKRKSKRKVGRCSSVGQVNHHHVTRTNT